MIFRLNLGTVMTAYIQIAFKNCSDSVIYFKKKYSVLKMEQQNLQQFPNISKIQCKNRRKSQY